MSPACLHGPAQMQPPPHSLPGAHGQGLQEASSVPLPGVYVCVPLLSCTKL